MALCPEMKSVMVIMLWWNIASLLPHTCSHKDIRLLLMSMILKKIKLLKMLRFIKNNKFQRDLLHSQMKWTVISNSVYIEMGLYDIYIYIFFFLYDRLVYLELNITDRITSNVMC